MGYFVKVSNFLLILLWIYAAFSKLIDFRLFEAAMNNQPLSPSLKTLLILFLPPVEIVVALLLSFRLTLKKGLYASLVLLLLFTGYISLSLTHFFAHIPCSCGGILEKMGWQAHLYFNLCFILITIAALIIVTRKGGKVTKTE